MTGKKAKKKFQNYDSRRVQQETIFEIARVEIFFLWNLFAFRTTYKKTDSKETGFFYLRDFYFRTIKKILNYPSLGIAYDKKCNEKHTYRSMIKERPSLNIALR